MYVGSPGRKLAAAQRGDERVPVDAAGGQRAAGGAGGTGVRVEHAVVGLPRFYACR